MQRRNGKSLIQMIMKKTGQRCFTLIGALFLLGCGTKLAQDPAKEKTNQEIVNHGYGQLYESVSGLKHIDKLLWVKFESDPVEKVIGDISEYAAKLEGELEKLAAKDKAVEIEQSGLPALAKRSRDSSNRERLKSLAPIVGSTGKDFERTFLLTQSGSLNQLRHLTRVTREAESDPERKTFLRDAERNFDDLYRRVVKLLDAEYFQKPAETWVPPKPKKDTQTGESQGSKRKGRG